MTPLLTQKALRALSVGRFPGTPSVLKPQQLHLILGFLVILKFTFTNTLPTLLSITERGRPRFTLGLPFGTAMLTVLPLSSRPSLVLPTRVSPLVTPPLTLVSTLPVSRLTMGSLLVESPFTRPKTEASLFPPLRHPTSVLLTRLPALKELSVPPVVPSTLLSLAPTKLLPCPPTRPGIKKHPFSNNRDKHANIRGIISTPVKSPNLSKYLPSPQCRLTCSCPTETLPGIVVCKGILSKPYSLCP